jgi:uncharacterized protein (DUF4415 family)
MTNPNKFGLMTDPPKSGLDGRHRDADGMISRKHGNTLISTLRQIYPGFAPGEKGESRLIDVLHRVDERSLSKLIKDVDKAQHAPGYVPNDRYTQEDWNEVSDHPESTDEELAQAKPFAEVFPDFYKSIIAKRGNQKAPTKIPTSIRLAPDVLAALRATGPGWQTLVSEILRVALQPIGKRAKPAHAKTRSAVRRGKHRIIKAGARKPPLSAL